MNFSTTFLPRKLTRHLGSHACRTVVECGWAGKKNGELLGLADSQFAYQPLTGGWHHHRARGEHK